MKKLRFYLDTSVLGAVFDVEDARRLEATETLLDRIRSGHGSRRGQKWFV